MPESSGSSRGPFGQIMVLIVLVLLVLYIAKIYLREPEYRHVEVCYLPYKVAHLVWVDAWGAVVSGDTATHLKHSRDLEVFFNSCTGVVGKQQWLRSIGTK